MEIFRANSQWANRPEDQRFTSLEQMRTVCKAYAENAVEAPDVPWKSLHFELSRGENPDLVVVGGEGQVAKIAYYAFGQLVSRIDEGKVVADYLRSLPPAVAADALNFGFEKKSDQTKAQLLFHRNGGMLLRAATSMVYKRIWNWEVCDRLIALQDQQGFQAATPDFTFSELPHSADPDLYASDHDMFAFVRHPDKAIDDGSEYGLRRGIIVSNSEVGDAALSVMYFLYRYQCGNHIIWGAQNVKTIQIAHTGKRVAARFDDYVAEVSQLLNGSATEEEAAIATARVTLIGKTKDEVLDALFGVRAQLGLSRKQITAGYDAAVPDEDGDPNTVWGYVNAITRHSQTVPYADERTTIDRAAGKVMQIKF